MDLILKLATHPKTTVMVLTAVKALKDKNGSSLQAIKKYIASEYNVDIDKLAPFIIKASMTSVLTKDVTHSTMHSFKPKTNNQPTI